MRVPRKGVVFGWGWSNKLITELAPNQCALTWLHKSHIEYLVHLTVVRGDVKDALGRVLNAGDVNRNQILGHLLPFDGAGSARWYMEDLCPQPERTIVG